MGTTLALRPLELTDASTRLPGKSVSWCGRCLLQDDIQLGHRVYHAARQTQHKKKHSQILYDPHEEGFAATAVCKS